MITFILSAIKIIILLGFLIFIHELGHFTVAKLCKVKVNEFAIGFGPTIWKKQGKETKYALRLFPLGGFVSMEGEEERSEDSRSFSKASIPKRIAIVVAGATVNIIFAVVIYFIISATSGTYISNEINSTINGYAAQSIDLKNGDKIVQIDNKKINNKEFKYRNITLSHPIICRHCLLWLTEKKSSVFLDMLSNVTNRDNGAFLFIIANIFIISILYIIFYPD